MKKQIRMIMLVAVSMLGVGTLMTTGCKSSEGGSTKRTTGTYVDDSSITAKIKSKMIGDSVVKAHEINVDTFQGNVQLNGFVDNAQQKQRAEEIARNTAGVVNVQNNLQLRPEAAGAGRSYNTQGSSGAQVEGQIKTNP
ncbi:MAG: BON domain-containing protein [Limisphaerales bacterium]